MVLPAMRSIVQRRRYAPPHHEGSAIKPREGTVDAFDCALLRRHLPWSRRRTGEVGCEFGVARFRFVCRPLLHRAVAADAIGQREEFDCGVVRGL